MEKKLMFLTAAVGGASAIELRKRLRHRNANWLRNDQGVGPAHQRGTHRGEDRAFEKGPEGGSTVAGRITDGGVTPPG
ncbi:MAG TPA: hypothetical protein VGR20_06945 [Acidimicrobiia bacterium]|jgi:hypothetical protein|nr:hypothetical protein [Acidimicrobiia bacterium]